MTKWTEEQIQYLKHNYKKITFLEIATKLGKTRNAVIGKADRMGLKKEKIDNVPRFSRLPVINSALDYSTITTKQCQFPKQKYGINYFCAEPVEMGVYCMECYSKAYNNPRNAK
jgi:hypothetical protein